MMDIYGFESCVAAFVEGRRFSTPPQTHGRGAETLLRTDHRVKEEYVYYGLI